MVFLIYGLVFILGLCFGSFVNMLEYRTAVGYKIKRLPRFARNDVGGRSFCDGCGKQLKWYENIPVISWLIQGGKTRCCRKKLSVSYPIVELVMGILFLIFVFIGRPQELPLQFGLGLLIIVFLVFSAVFDWKYMILPDFSTGILIICSLIFIWAIHESPLRNVLAGAGAGAFLGLLYLVTKGRGMGMGDVKLAVFMGLFLSYPKIILAFYIAFVVGAVVGGFLMLLGRAKKDSQISFGPYLILGTVIAWWSGDFVINLINKWW
ncbi:MAG: prepilin peptidase [Candidatus Shapirobacteria bacterium]|nr:prepilin peptidase [Candidatus Shapirobacteria bacterium]